MSIEWEKSAALNGVSVEALKARFEKYPKSNKRIVTICDDCGCERDIYFSQYSNLCHPCRLKLQKGKNNPNHKDKIEVICSNCGEKLSMTLYHKELSKIHFCNSKCKGEWQSKNIKGKKHPKYKDRIKVTCDTCGKTIEKNQSNVRDNNFCSSECFYKSYKIPTINVKCDYCGRTIVRKESDINDHNFCDKKCYGEWRSKNLIGKNNPNYKNDKIKVICSNCGKILLRNQHRIEITENHFCNSKCNGEWRTKNLIGKNSSTWKGGKIEVTCSNCGKTLLKQKNQVERSKYHFCNRKCRDNWQSENYTNKERPHLTPCHTCINLNPKFKGCNRHHIMSGVVVNIPADLHRSISHRFPHDNIKAKNMKEINELAYNYLMGNI